MIKKIKNFIFSVNLRTLMVITAVLTCSTLGLGGFVLVLLKDTQLLLGVVFGSLIMCSGYYTSIYIVFLRYMNDKKENE